MYVRSYTVHMKQIAEHLQHPGGIFKNHCARPTVATAA